MNLNGQNGHTPPRHALPLDHVHPEYRTLSEDEHKSKARAKLQEYLTQGAERARSVVDRIFNEVPTDRLVVAHKLDFQPAAAGVDLVMPDGQREALHRHAVGQLATRAGIPATYWERLAGEAAWGPELLATNLRELTRHMPAGDRLLTRSVNGQVRGVLSDRYRRMDSRPIAESVIETAKGLGGIVADGLANDTKLSLRILHPRVVQVAGEHLIFGMTWGNSDYGDGALDFALWALRLICLNGAKVETALRKVHIGGRLGESIAFSERTYQLDTEATASASRDVVTALLSGEKVKELTGRIERAVGEGIDPKAILGNLRATNRLSKGEADKVAVLYNTPDIEVLPPGQNRWRMSNAVSYLAHEVDDVARRMELEALAGSLMTA